MLIHSFIFRKKYIFLILLITIFLLSIGICFYISEASENNYIKWVDFTPTYKILQKVADLDINSHTKNEDVQYDWIELLSYLAARYGGNFKRFSQKDLDTLVLRIKSGETMDEITKDMKYYPYYFQAYTAILSEFIGEYSIQTVNKEGEVIWQTKYGIKAFLPIAKNFSFSHYDDFGNSRSYGYKRIHFGNDLMGRIGTPIIAVESGVVEAVGWNQYGGWRIGVRSFDKKRYYYYAHLRKDHPYNGELLVGQVIKAGDVIGYLGMTGYSSKENVNNINVPHLHFGIQLIFHESQKDSANQLWIDVYHIVEFLKQNRSEVYYDSASKEYYRKYDFMEKAVME